jgi:hypothetical protein
MTRKQIDAGRELRLWITQVIIPAAAVVMMFPEAREATVSKARELKEKFKRKSRK